MSNEARVNATPYGTMTIERLQNPSEFSQQLSAESRVELCTWRPPADLADELPPTHELQMACCALGSGTRYFRFIGEVDSFIQLARAGGLAALLHERKIASEDLLHYRSMFLLYDWLRSRSLRLKREFATPMDLVLRRRSRGGENYRDVLPESLGLDAQGNGTRWNVTNLLAEGRSSVTEGGTENPPEDDVIARGFMAAAMRNPLHAQPSDVAHLTRYALYSLEGEPTSADAQELVEVYLRLRRAWQRHIERPSKDFDAWFRGEKSNLEKTLANLSGSQKMDRKIVRSSLAELGWRGHFFVAQCLWTQMTWFARSLDCPLTDDEMEILTLTFCPHADFGGLSLIMLKDRINLVRPFVPKLLTNGHRQETIAELHRVLSWYTEIVDKRRAADRLTKRRATSTGGAGVEVDLDPESVRYRATSSPERTKDLELYGRLAERVSQRSDCRCSQCGKPMDVQLDADHEPFPLGQPVRFLGTCAAHPSTHQAFEVPWSELERLAIEAAKDA